MPESLADTVGGKIFTFGSYRLGALIRCLQILEINISKLVTIFMTLRASSCLIFDMVSGFNLDTSV